MTKASLHVSSSHASPARPDSQSVPANSAAPPLPLSLTSLSLRGQRVGLVLLDELGADAAEPAAQRAHLVPIRILDQRGAETRRLRRSKGKEGPRCVGVSGV